MNKEEIKETIKELIEESFEVGISVGHGNLFASINAEEIATHLMKHGVYAFPCNINDEVWENIYTTDGHYRHTIKSIVVGFHVGDYPDHLGHKRKEYLVLYSLTMDQTYHRDLDLIGDTIFFSREESEAHRERRKKND